MPSRPDGTSVRAQTIGAVLPRILNPVADSVEAADISRNSRTVILTAQAALSGA